MAKLYIYSAGAIPVFPIQYRYLPLTGTDIVVTTAAAVSVVAAIITVSTALAEVIVVKAVVLY